MATNNQEKEAIMSDEPLGDDSCYRNNGLHCDIEDLRRVGHVQVRHISRVEKPPLKNVPRYDPKLKKYVKPKTMLLVPLLCVLCCFSGCRSEKERKEEARKEYITIVVDGIMKASEAMEIAEAYVKKHNLEWGEAKGAKVEDNVYSVYFATTAAEERELGKRTIQVNHDGNVQPLQRR